MKKNLFQNILLISYYLLGLLLLISTFACFLEPSSLPLFSIIALFFPVLWILNFLYLLIFSYLKKRLAFVSLTLLLFGIHQVSLVFNIATNNNYEKPDILNIVSFNSGNSDTLNPNETRIATFKQIQFLKSDILCLQEFTNFHEKEIDVLENFKHKVSVDYYGNYYSDSSGLSVYTNYEITNFGHLKQELEDTYALWCIIVINNDTINLINVQLQSIRLEEDELESMTELTKSTNLPGNLVSIYSKLERGFLWREEQVAMLEEFITGSNYPVVLCGDFNDPPSSYTYVQIAKLLNDSFLKKGNGLGTTYAGKLPLLRIDYIMVEDGIEVMSYDKINSTYSDHYGICVGVGL